jgi:hypothetical protein
MEPEGSSPHTQEPATEPASVLKVHFLNTIISSNCAVITFILHVLVFPNNKLYAEAR